VALSGRPVALTIAGSDSGGGAGMVADLKTFEAFGVWGTVALTAVTAQNTVGVTDAQLIAAETIESQIAAVAGDLGVDAAKTGMLGSAGGARAAVAGIRAAGIDRLVVDAVAILREELFPLALVITPNLPEAAGLLDLAVGSRDQMLIAAAALHRLGPALVLLKGGHLADGRSPDLLYDASGPRWLDGPRIDTPHTHGSGCVLSAAITAELALGRDPVAACLAAKRFVTGAIRAGWAAGGGAGPVDPGWERVSARSSASGAERAPEMHQPVGPLEVRPERGDVGLGQ